MNDEATNKPEEEEFQFREVRGETAERRFTEEEPNFRGRNNTKMYAPQAGFDGESDPVEKYSGRIFVTCMIVVMVVVNTSAIYQIFDQKRVKSNKFSLAIEDMIDKGLPERDDSLASIKNDLTLREMSDHIDNIAQSFDLNSLSLFHLDNNSNITYSLFGIDRSDKTHSLANRSTSIQEILNVTDYKNLTNFKSFLVQYKYLKIVMDGLQMKEKTLKNEVICYKYNITINYDYFYLKTSKVSKDIEVTENCCVYISSFNYELMTARNLYVVQLLFGIFFLYKAIKTWYDLMRIVERVNVKLRHGPNLRGEKEQIELDFNFYRFMLSRNVKSSIITRLDLRYFSTYGISMKLIRPLYYVCLFGYIVQIFSSCYHLYGVYFMQEVTQAQLNLTALAIMCSWVDLYSITSQTNETGIVNDTFFQVYKQFFYFTVYILIVLAAFAAFALCIFNQSIYFSNLIGTSVALFAFMYGDSIRATFLTYQDSPFSIIFLVSIIIVLYSCLAQFYLAVFTIKFQTTSDKTAKLIGLMKKKEEGFLRMQKEIIDSKSKKFGEEISYLMDYLDRKSKIVRTTTLREPGRKLSVEEEEDERTKGNLLSIPEAGESRRESIASRRIKALDDDIASTFNEAKLPEKQKSLLRKTFLNMSFSNRHMNEDGDDEFAKDPMYEFFDSIIKTSVLEILIKLIIFKDYTIESIKTNQQKDDDDEINTQMIVLYENTIRQFILSVEHIRNIIKSNLDIKSKIS